MKWPIKNENTEELCKKRAKRFETAAINVSRPDRVPYCILDLRYFAARYYGITYQEFSYDYDKNLKASLQVARNFDFDYIFRFTGGCHIPFPPIFGNLFEPFPMDFGTFHDILGDKYTKWPGRELAINQPAQYAYVDMPYMMENEYDEFARNPIEFMIEKLIPRAYRNLENPGSSQYYATLIRLGVEAVRAQQYSAKILEKLKELGYPRIPSLPAFTINPLDYMADFLRGHTLIMIDLFKRPEKVMNAINALIEIELKSIKSAADLWTKTKTQVRQLFDVEKPIVMGAVGHLNEMLSPKLFEKFYWEPAKLIVKRLVEVGAHVFLFFEGNFTPYLHYILELPKGKIIVYFEKTDLKKARKVLGTHAAIMGGIPASYFITGTPKKVFEECCKLLDDVKEPGGFIYSGTGIGGLPDETKPENLKASIEAVKKCGKYS